MSHDSLIGRLPVDKRLEILDAIAQATSFGSIVAVEHSYWRQLDQTATTLVGRILGVGHNHGGGARDCLIVEPIEGDRRINVIPAPHVLRVRWAMPAQDLGAPATYRLGEVLAGPPLTPDSATTAHGKAAL